MQPLRMHLQEVLVSHNIVDLENAHFGLLPLRGHSQMIYNYFLSSTILFVSMDLSTCSAHTNRKQEMLCLSDQCEHRFQLRCVQCVMGSKCRQAHNWKIITEVIEEVFELCENKQIKAEKKGTDKKEPNPANTKIQKEIEAIVSDFMAKIQNLQHQIMTKISTKAKKLSSRVNSGVDTHIVVREILKTCKKNTQPESLRDNLQEVSHYVRCKENGELDLVEPGQEESVGDSDISMFQSDIQQLLDNLYYMVQESNEMPSQIEEMKKSYQQQIDKLLDQVKQHPVLQNRIQSLKEKLQAKETKLKKYESGSTDIKDKSPLNKKESVEESDVANSKNIVRIQTLIDRRQQLRNHLIQYCQKNPQEELYMYTLKANETATKISVPAATQVSYLLNDCSLSLADELQFLNYNDQTSGETYIDIPLISIKKQMNQQHQQKAPQKKHPEGHPLNNFFNFLGTSFK